MILEELLFGVKAEIYKNVGLFLAITAGFALPYAITWYKKSAKRFFNVFNKNNELRAKINSIIDEVRIRLQSQAVRVFAYHNGVYSKSGFPFDYCSIVYEKTDDNTKDIMSGMQHLPISMFSDLLTVIIAYEEDGFVRQSQKNVTGAALQQLIAYNAFTVYHFLLNGKTEDGVMSVIFSGDVTLNQREIDWCKYRAHEIFLNEKKLK